MTGLDSTEPHYHLVETEIYIVLQGKGVISVGGEVWAISQGDVVTTPPSISHFTVPRQDLVMAAINTPAFKLENYVSLSKSSEKVRFDKVQYNKLNKSSK